MLQIFDIKVSLRDFLDIGIIALIYYYLILLVRGTRAVAVIVGLSLLLVVYFLAEKLGLLTLHWLLTNFLGSIFLVIIILFKNDIRRALAQMGGGSLFKRQQIEELLLDELVTAVLSMSKKRVGALIVIERSMPLGDIVERGRLMDATITSDLLETVFQTSAPLHDGAVIIREGRLAAAACVLPLSTKFRGQTVFGTRHRAALGISEETDAITVVVSEETGDVSVAMNGRITTSLDETRLRRVIRNVLVK
ncbi:MAG: diadenylate cyclase CdaA [Proteobacteria bacterium]|nr:diadenylate cyclase CdaA [Pseudomonadota bacterium]